MTVTRRGIRRVVLTTVLLCLGWAFLQIALATLDGRAATRALRDAERALGRRDVAAADRALAHAEREFAQLGQRARSLGPAGPVLRATPFVRLQVGALGRFGTIGADLSAGAREVTAAVERVSAGGDTDRLALVREMRTALDRAHSSVDRAARTVDELRDDRLVWPLSTRQHELFRRVPTLQRRVTLLRDGLVALDRFAGGAGPRRYLVVSQNPDEVRPTGGFIGTYGVLTAVDGAFRLERYAAIEDWYRAHPEAAIPVKDAATPLQLAVPQSRQNIANVNTTPDWPRSAALARTLWRRGGEHRVDGVVSVTPDFLARVLAVLGPTRLPSYPETVTAENLVELADKYTHSEAGRAQRGGRKAFVGVLARVVLEKLVDAPRERWLDLAEVTGAGFTARELLVWSADPVVQRPLAAAGWDGALPATDGDFLVAGEFAYAAKNGRGLRRVFEHVVRLREDGSARIETTLAISNTDPPSRYNVDSQSYVVLYGPAGARLVAGESDPPDATEPPLAGHPAAGWLRAAKPGERTTIRAVWEVPRLLVRDGDGWRYRLQARPTPAHPGDVLRLTVVTPSGWRWDGDRPHSEYRLDGVLSREWRLSP